MFFLTIRLIAALFGYKIKILGGIRPGLLRLVLILILGYIILGFLVVIFFGSIADLDLKGTIIALLVAFGIIIYFLERKNKNIKAGSITDLSK